VRKLNRMLDAIARLSYVPATGKEEPWIYILPHDCVQGGRRSRQRSSQVFVGHYGPSFAAKALRKSIPLWVLFLAVQLLDVFWSIGIEKVRIVPGITATNPLDLYYMPYTHGLDAAVLWSGAAAFAYWAWRRSEGWVAATIVGVAVFSHWVLDLIVHRPDLPLYDNSLKVGLGLWNQPAVALALEIAVLFGGMYLYWAVTEPTTKGGRYAMVIFGLVMLAIQVFLFFGPPPASDRAAATSALACYVASLALHRGWKENVLRGLVG
jgi:hypothetical protein